MNNKYRLKDEFENAFQRATMKIKEFDLNAVAEFFLIVLGTGHKITLDQTHSHICNLLGIDH